MNKLANFKMVSIYESVKSQGLKLRFPNEILTSVGEEFDIFKIWRINYTIKITYKMLELVRGGAILKLTNQMLTLVGGGAWSSAHWRRWACIGVGPSEQL